MVGLKIKKGYNFNYAKVKAQTHTDNYKPTNTHTSIRHTNKHTLITQFSIGPKNNYLQLLKNFIQSSKVIVGKVVEYFTQGYEHILELSEILDDLESLK